MPAQAVATTDLRELRKARGMGLRELEASTGIHRGTLSRIERGSWLPEPGHLAALSLAFNVPVESWRIRFVLETEVR